MTIGTIVVVFSEKLILLEKFRLEVASSIQLGKYNFYYMSMKYPVIGALVILGYLSSCMESSVSIAENPTGLYELVDDRYTGNCTVPAMLELTDGFNLVYSDPKNTLAFVRTSTLEYEAVFKGKRSVLVIDSLQNTFTVYFGERIEIRGRLLNKKGDRNLFNAYALALDQCMEMDRDL